MNFYRWNGQNCHPLEKHSGFIVLVWQSGKLLHQKKLSEHQLKNGLVIDINVTGSGYLISLVVSWKFKETRFAGSLTLSRVFTGGTVLSYFHTFENAVHFTSSYPALEMFFSLRANSPSSMKGLIDVLWN